MLEALTEPFFQRVLLAGLLASVAAGVIGTYVVVRRIASLAGGLSHAAFGGVGLGYWAGFPPIAGAAGFALVASLVVGLAERRVRSGIDTLGKPTGNAPGWRRFCQRSRIGDSLRYWRPGDP